MQELPETQEKDYDIKKVLEDALVILAGQFCTEEINPAICSTNVKLMMTNLSLHKSVDLRQRRLTLTPPINNTKPPLQEIYQRSLDPIFRGM